MKTRYAFALAAMLALLHAVDAAGQTMSPVNPKFLEWQKRRAAAPVTTTNAPSRKPLRGAMSAGDGDETEETGFGLVPTVMDMDYLADINAGVVRAPIGGFPSSYDLRAQGRVSPVRDQGDYGTCWAFAAMGSLESWVAGNEDAAIDFSENNLVNLHGWDWGFNEGGNASMATAYFVRCGGPVAESSDPYPVVGGSQALAPVRHIQKVVWVPGKSDSLDNDAIKEAVMERGALYVSYYHASSYYKSATTSYFYPGSRSSNHAVTIVGWDDDYPASNFATRPSGNGAYLVRNSWGADWGGAGYYWVSYYDGVFARSTMYSFCNAEPAGNYGKIYQHDPLGMVSAFSASWGANMFAATGADSIAAVGFYSLAPKTSYSISVYTGCQSGKPTSGTCALTQAGTASEPGYVTVPLSQTVSVASGTRFSIVIKLTTPGYSYPHAIEYAYTGITSGAGAAAGQSFYSSNGHSWTDLTQWNGTANFCIKAYTTAAVATPDLASISISGPSTVESGKTAVYSCTAKYTDSSERTVSAEWSVVSGSSYASIASDGTLTAAETAIDGTVVIRAAYAERGVAKSADWQLTVTAGPPQAPTGLSATQGTETRAVRLSWTAASGADAYAIYRSATDSSANAAYLGVAEATKYSDTSAIPGRDYRYFVKARNSSGTGPFSEGASGWRALAAPADMAASDGSSLDGVVISWSAAEGAARYRVSRSDTINGDFAPVSGWIEATEFFDDTAVAGVKYWYSVTAATDASGSRPSERGVPDDGFRAIPILPESLAVEGAASIVSGVTSSYSAYAVYSDGSRGASPVSPTWHVSKGSVARNGTVTAPVVSTNEEVMLTASTTLEGVAVSGSKIILVTAVAPSAPTGVVALASSPSQGVAVAWRAVPGASGYRVYRSVGAPPMQSCIGAVSTTNFADNTATPGVTYEYRVSAVNGAGESAMSDPSTATVPLAAPTGLTATMDREDCVHVTWNAVAGASHYRVARAASANGEKTMLGTWTTAQSFDDMPTAAGVTYFYFVQAATTDSGVNSGPWSEPAEGRMKPLRTLVSLSITGPDQVPSSGEAVYSCTASYSDGTGEPVSPTWSVTGLAAIDHDGRLTALAVSTNSSVTVAAYFQWARATKSVTVIAPAVATATVTSVFAAQRWPFSGLIDIDYTLETSPADTLATISVSATDHDHGRSLAATTLSGDGASGPVSAGSHRITWNLAADHPGFHAAAMDVSIEAVPAKLVTVTLDGNGGTPSAASMSGIAGTAYGTLPMASRNGYDLVGWFTALEGGTQVTASSLFDESVTNLYAHWEVDAAHATYMVIDLSGGTDATNYPVSYLADVPMGGWTDEYKTTKLVLRRIEAGTFTMGSPYDPNKEFYRHQNETQHQVTLTDPFYIGVFEVTQTQWEMVMGYNPSYVPSGNLTNSPNYFPSDWLQDVGRYPVESVDYMAVRGLRWGRQTTYTGVDPDSFIGRCRAKTGIAVDLPTEAQWEYACRAGSSSMFYNGTELKRNSDNTIDESGLAQIGRYEQNSRYVYPQDRTLLLNAPAVVGSYEPNNWGLYDMVGNVSELCQDWYQQDLGSQSVTNPFCYSYQYSSGPTHRGGCYMSSSDDCRVATRGAGHGNNNTGFRLYAVAHNGKSGAFHPIIAVCGGFSGEYDGQGHGVNVSILHPSAGATVKYALAEDGPYSEECPLFTNVCRRTIWVELSSPGYDTQTNCAVVHIQNSSWRYAIIDVSGGQNAIKYPITFLDREPDGGWTEEYKTDKIVLRLVEPGTFIMGNQYETTLTKAFYTGVFEITQKQYENVMGVNPSNAKGDARPVECVSYADIRGANMGSQWPASAEVDQGSFLGRLRVRTGVDFDLPTEAQWEYACRAGTTTDLNSGHNLVRNDIDSNLALLGRYWYNRNDGNGGYVGITSVGSYLPNAWGLYDMHGNVWEWCLDWSGNLSNLQTDPVGAETSSKRVGRGGSCQDYGYVYYARNCTSSYRGECHEPANGYYYGGFRLAATVQDYSTGLAREGFGE